MESLVSFVREDVAKGTIGPEGSKYAPYLLAMFLFILVGNLFGDTVHQLPPDLADGDPLMLSLFTWLIFVFVGFSHGDCTT